MNSRGCRLLRQPRVFFVATIPMDRLLSNKRHWRKISKSDIYSGAMRAGSYKCLLTTMGLGLLCSCAHSPSTQSEAPVVIPESYAAAVGNGAYPDRWWTSFKDERLNDLVSEALDGNFGLRQVQHRLEQAHAVARKAGAEQVPQVNVGASATRSRSRVTDATGTKTIQVANQFGLDLAASYEIDLWGRVSATKRAAALDAQTARDNLDTAAMTLVAQIAEGWYQLVSLEERLALLRGQIESSEDQVRLLELRFDTGHSTALDVWQQREQLAALRTLSPRLEAAQATTRHQLAVLLGRPPQMTQDFVLSGWPALPQMPDTGVPADLLQKRPDVRAALKAVHAADERVAAALADRLPALRLTASTGYSAAEASDLFDDWLWNIAGNLLGPVLDGGRRRAEAERSRAAARESLARCGEVLLNAMREVEDALVNESKQSEILERQTEQHEISRQTLQQARSRYQRGLSDYLPVLTALAREQSVARALAETRRERFSYRIQLHRSLGGHWMQSEVGNAALTGGEKAHE